MNMNITREKAETPFGALEVGDWFEFDEHIFVKIKPIQVDFHYFVAVDITTGEPNERLSDDDIVNEIDNVDIKYSLVRRPAIHSIVSVGAPEEPKETDNNE